MGMMVLEFLSVNKGKAFTAKEFRNHCVLTSRKELRELEREGLITKTVTYLKNTVKKDLKGNNLQGTMAYKYSLV